MASVYTSQYPTHESPLVHRLESQAFIGGSVASILSSTTSKIKLLRIPASPQTDDSLYDSYAQEIFDALATGLKSLHKMDPPKSKSRPDFVDQLLSQAITSHLQALVNVTTSRINPIVQIASISPSLFTWIESITQVLAALLEDLQLLLPNYSTDRLWEAFDSASPSSP